MPPVRACTWELQDVQGVTQRLAELGRQGLAGTLSTQLADPSPAKVWDMACRGHTLAFGRRTLLMGVLNVTPDSFSDGGAYLTPERALARAREMVTQGADLIDVGGESTRPGAAAVGTEEEAARVLPVIESLTAAGLTVPISIDTSKAEVARMALAAGAHMVNDVTGLQGDPAMAEVVAAAAAPAILMHMRGTPRSMQQAPSYGSVVGEVLAELEDRVEGAVRAGIARDRLLVDPGIGFGKTLEHNLEILRGLRAFGALGCPVLLGASRKSFLGRLTDLPADGRAAGTAATTAFAIGQGVDVLRVHDVDVQLQVARVSDALVRDWRRVDVYVGLGSNLGDKVEHLQAGINGLQALPDTRVAAWSSLYRTEPVGYTDQDDFLNAVVHLQTGLAPGRLLRELAAVEASRGRVRRRLWGPRSLDLDILLYGHETVQQPGLKIPHPRATERRFVLAPLLEVAPDVVWQGRTAVQHLGQLPQDQAAERIQAPEAWWQMPQ